MSPGTPDYLVVAYLHTRWALGDHRRPTHQLRRFRQHGGHVDNTRWSRCWLLARHRYRATRQPSTRNHPATTTATQGG